MKNFEIFHKSWKPEGIMAGGGRPGRSLSIFYLFMDYFLFVCLFIRTTYILMLEREGLQAHEICTVKHFLMWLKWCDLKIYIYTKI